MKSIKLALMQVLFLACLSSGQGFAVNINKSGLIGLAHSASLKEYVFSLPQGASVTFDLSVLEQSAGDLEVTLLLAQGVEQYLKIDLNNTNTIPLASGEYQLMVYAKLLDADYAHVAVKVSSSAVLVDDVITLLDAKIENTNTYRKVQHYFSLSEQAKVTLELTDYSQLTDFPSELESPLKHVFFTMNNIETAELKYYGGIDGLLDSDLGVGNYRLHVHLIADQDAHNANPGLTSGLGWSLTSKNVDFGNLELISSESISNLGSQGVYDLGVIDFGEGGNYDFSMGSILGLNIGDEKVLFVQGAQSGGSLTLSSGSLEISDTYLSGIYQVFAFVQEEKSGALKISVKRSDAGQAYWTQVLPLGEARLLKHITLLEESQAAVEIKDLGFANVMQSAQFALTNGLDTHSFSLAEGSKNLEEVVKSGEYSLLATTEAEGNALLYLDIQAGKGESLYQDYVFEGRGGFYAEVVTLSGGDYAVSAKDHVGNSYSAVLLQKDKLLYKHQSFGSAELFSSDLINLSPGEYVLAFAVDPSEADTMVLGYALSANVSEEPFVPASTNRSLGGPGGKKNSGGSLGCYFLVVLLVAACCRITIDRRRAFP